MKGLDFAYMYPGATWIKANGFGFVCRYLSWLPNAKVIDKAEFDSYRAAGIDVVLNWEWDTTDMLGGAANGQSHATEARRQAEALGAWPCVIYFSCDADATEAQQVAINAHLAAAGAVLGGAQYVGIYGGYWPVKRAMEAGLAGYGWQTYAWSGGLWYGPAQLRQVPGGDSNWDADQAMVDRFGQVGMSIGPSLALAPKRRNPDMVIYQAEEDGAQFPYNGRVGEQLTPAQSAPLVHAGVPVEIVPRAVIDSFPKDGPLVVRGPDGTVASPIPGWRHIAPPEYGVMLRDNAVVEQVDQATVNGLLGKK